MNLINGNWGFSNIRKIDFDWYVFVSGATYHMFSMVMHFFKNWLGNDKKTTTRKHQLEKKDTEEEYQELQIKRIWLSHS